MANFCSQCAIAILGEDSFDLAGIPQEGGEPRSVLCEGCGLTWVDPTGRCVSNDCLEKGHGDATGA